MELHHYTRQAGLMGILSSRSIWATDCRYLNDESEMRLAFDYAIKQCTSELGKLPFGSFASEAVLNVIGKLHQAWQGGVGTFVTSFPERGNLLSQWRAYGSPGDCFSIRFARRDLDLLAHVLGWRLKDCIYSPSDWKPLVDRILSYWLARLPNEPKPDPVTRQYLDAIDTARENLSDRLIRLAPRIKASGFEEEAEWRLISPHKIDPGNYPTIEFRSGKDYIVPYTTVDLRECIDWHNLEVRVGPTSQPEASKAAIRTMYHKFGLKGPIEAANIPFRG